MKRLWLTGLLLGAALCVAGIAIEWPASKPVAVAMMSGLRTSSRTNPRWAWRAMGQTAATLNRGTQTPIKIAMSSSADGPATRSAKAC